MTLRVILVPGTHAWDGQTADWYTPNSPFVASLAARGIGLVGGDRPYVWSTDLGGAVPLTDRDTAVWAAAGINLYAYVVPPLGDGPAIPPDETYIIAHSHGLQVVLYACAYGLEVETLISVGSPVRQDMARIAAQARPRIRRWVHISGGHRDWWQVLGALFDGRVGVVRHHPWADENVTLPKCNHEDALRNPAYFHVVGDALLGSVVPPAID